jgi:hypothetical protein
VLNGPFAEVGRPVKDEKSKAKESESQKGPKQTTLFGLPAVASNPGAKKPKAPTKGGSNKVIDMEENETQETQDGTTESQGAEICGIQGDEEMEETQVLPLAKEPQGMDDNDEEPIEWPDSPPQSEVD